MIILESIAFNHEPGSTRDAQNIRRNRMNPVIVPEWQSTGRVRESLAAYAMERTRGQTLTVKATFRRQSPSVQSVAVRTSSAPPSGTRSLPQIALRIEQAL